MAGDKRRVDSAVLRDLAGATQAKRDRLDTFYNECRSRVDSAPRGWSTGEWDGTHTFMLHELQQMDKERQELVDRARIVDVAAALAVLPNPLSAWRSFLKLFQPASTTPNRPWTAQDQALFERARMIQGLAKKSGYTLTQDEFLKLRDGSLGEKGIEAQIDRLKVISEFRHIDQMAAEKDAYGTAKGYSFGNADCVPASAAMALMSIGVRPPGYSTGTSAGALVSSVRHDMATTDYKDGVNQDGSYSNSEHGIGMDDKDILNINGKVPGVKVSNSTKYDSVTIRDSLAAGSSVVVSGNFNGRGSGEPWAHDYFSDKATNTNHVIAVTAYDPVSGLYTVNDPGRSAAITVTADALDKFTARNGDAWTFTRIATAP